MSRRRSGSVSGPRPQSLSFSNYDMRPNAMQSQMQHNRDDTDETFARYDKIVRNLIATYNLTLINDSPHFKLDGMEWILSADVMHAAADDLLYDVETRKDPLFVAEIREMMLPQSDNLPPSVKTTGQTIVLIKKTGKLPFTQYPSLRIARFLGSAMLLPWIGHMAYALIWASS